MGNTKSEPAWSGAPPAGFGATPAPSVEDPYGTAELPQLPHVQPNRYQPVEAGRGGNDGGHRGRNSGGAAGGANNRNARDLRPVMGRAEEAPDDADGYLAVDPEWLEKQNKLMAGKPWFRGAYSRQEATEELFTAPKGTFVVRISSQPGHYAISVKLSKTKMESMLILPSWDSRKQAEGETLYRLGSTSTMMLDSVPELIEYYARHPFYNDRDGVHFLKVIGDTDGLGEGTAGYMELAAEQDDIDTKRQAKKAALGYGVGGNSGLYDNGNQDWSKPADAEDDEEMGYCDVQAADDHDDNDGARAHDPFGMPSSSVASAASLPGGLVLSAHETRVFSALWILASKGQPDLGPGEAVAFFRASGLDNLVLGGIWTIADEKRRGRLNRDEFFLASKLVAVVQSGSAGTLANVNKATPLPALGDFSSEALRTANDPGFNPDDSADA